MRAPLATAVVLTLVAVPAFAHEGHSIGLELSNLELTWDPLTLAAHFAFDLENTMESNRTGAIFGSAEMNGGVIRQNNVRVSSTGLGPGESARLALAVPLRVAAEGCVFVFGTASGQGFPGRSNEECATFSGLTAIAQVPDPSEIEAPGVPEVPTPPEPPAVPEVPGVLP